MKRPRWLLISALVLLAVLLGGCINIQQEYWLKADGSAQVSMDIGMSTALLSMGSSSGGGTSTSNPFQDIKKEFDSTNPYIKNVKVREYTDKDLQHIALTFDVPNFELFLKNQTKQEGELDITLAHQPNGNILFTQITQLNAASDQTSGLDPSSMSSMFKDMYWTVTVHVPQVISTNGIRMDNNTVQWKIPMADVFAGKAPASLTVEYKPVGEIGGGLLGGSGSGSTAGTVLIVVVLLVLALGGGAAFYFLVLRKRAAPAAASAYPGYPGYPTATEPYGGYPPPPPGAPAPEDPSFAAPAGGPGFSAPEGGPGFAAPAGGQPAYPPPYVSPPPADPALWKLPPAQPDPLPPPAESGCPRRGTRATGSSVSALPAVPAGSAPGRAAPLAARLLCLPARFSSKTAAAARTPSARPGGIIDARDLGGFGRRMPPKTTQSLFLLTLSIA